MYFIEIIPTISKYQILTQFTDKRNFSYFFSNSLADQRRTFLTPRELLNECLVQDENAHPHPTLSCTLCALSQKHFHHRHSLLLLSRKVDVILIAILRLSYYHFYFNIACHRHKTQSWTCSLDYLLSAFISWYFSISSCLNVFLSFKSKPPLWWWRLCEENWKFSDETLSLKT